MGNRIFFYFEIQTVEGYSMICQKLIMTFGRNFQIISNFYKIAIKNMCEILLLKHLKRNLSSLTTVKKCL